MQSNILRANTQRGCSCAPQNFIRRCRSIAPRERPKRCRLCSRTSSPVPRGSCNLSSTNIRSRPIPRRSYAVNGSWSARAPGSMGRVGRVGPGSMGVIAVKLFETGTFSAKTRRQLCAMGNYHERRHDRLPITKTIADSIVVTRKRHVFEGRRLFVIRSLVRRGVPEFLVILPDGSRTLIPTAWTDRNGGLDTKPSSTLVASDGLEDLCLIGDLLKVRAVVDALLSRLAK